MTVLVVNGLTLSSIMATAEEPKGERRDIGEQAAANDGSLRITRQTRKRDVSFKTIPLSDANAFPWEMLLTGEGEAWSFDASLYGCKGLGPSSSTAATLITAAPAPKFGAKCLQLGATTGSVAYQAAVNSFGSTAAWTVMVWRFESGAWHHYIIRSDGAKWYDGVQNNSVITTWLTVSSGLVTLANATGAAVQYDDLVVLPFKVLDAWPPTFGVASSAYAPPPYLDLSGDQVVEQTTRRVLGQVTESLVKTAAGVMHKLDVKLMAK